MGRRVSGVARKMDWMAGCVGGRCESAGESSRVVVYVAADRGHPPPVSLRTVLKLVTFN